MVLMYEPLRDAISAARGALGGSSRTVHLSPQGRRIEQRDIRKLAQEPAVVLLCGRYEGVDERLLETEVDEEVSLGDYVLSGGELAAMVLIDAVTRLIPGALGHDESAGADSFSDGLLDWPHYTRPEVVAGRAGAGHTAVGQSRRDCALAAEAGARPHLGATARVAARARAGRGGAVAA